MPFFGEQRQVPRVPSEWFLVQASTREGERAFHSAGAAMTPGHGQFGSCSKSHKIKPLAHKWLMNSMVSRPSLF